MIGWIVQFVYPVGELMDKQTVYIHIESADVDINSIEERIKYILENTYSVAIYVDGCADTDHTLAINIWEDEARIFEKDGNGMRVTTEEAKKFLHKVFLQIAKQSKEMREAGID